MKAITFRRTLLAMIVAMFGMGSLAHAGGGLGDKDEEGDQGYPAPPTQQYETDSGDQDDDYPTPPPAQ